MKRKKKSLIFYSQVSHSFAYEGGTRAPILQLREYSLRESKLLTQSPRALKSQSRAKVTLAMTLQGFHIIVQHLFSRKKYFFCFMPACRAAGSHRTGYFPSPSEVKILCTSLAIWTEADKAFVLIVLAVKTVFSLVS